MDFFKDLFDYSFDRILGFLIEILLNFDRFLKLDCNLLKFIQLFDYLRSRKIGELLDILETKHVFEYLYRIFAFLFCSIVVNFIALRVDEDVCHLMSDDVVAENHVQGLESVARHKFDSCVLV